MMKKTLLVIALNSAGLVAAAAASAQDMSAGNGGWFLNGNVGQASLDHGPYDDDTTGYAINGGCRWAINPSAAWGVEAGYNDLGNIHAKNIFHSGPVIRDDKSQLHGWTAGVNGHFNVSPNGHVSRRMGLYSRTSNGLSNEVNPVRKVVDDPSRYAGAALATTSATTSAWASMTTSTMRPGKTSTWTPT